MASPSNGIGVAFDHAALEAGMQRIVEERLQSRDLANGEHNMPRSPRVGHSSHSSITVFDDSGGGETACAPLGDMSRYFTEDIETRHTDLLLLICTFASGMLDSAAFNAWGSFANMQTGSYTRPLARLSYAQLTAPHPGRKHHLPGPRRVRSTSPTLEPLGRSPHCDNHVHDREYPLRQRVPFSRSTATFDSDRLVRAANCSRHCLQRPRANRYCRF